MSLKNRFLLLIPLVTCVLVSNLFSQSSEVDKVLALLDNGRITGNVYETKLLGLRIRFPKTMEVDTEAEVKTDLREGIAMLRQGKSVDQKLIDEMIRKDRIIFALNIPQTEDSVGAAMNLTIKKEVGFQELRPMVERTIKFFTESGKQKLEKAVGSETYGGLNFLSLRSRWMSMADGYFRNFTVRKGTDTC